VACTPPQEVYKSLNQRNNKSIQNVPVPMQAVLDVDRLFLSMLWCSIVCVSVCWSYGWAMQKWLNRLRCHLGCRLPVANGTMYYVHGGTYWCHLEIQTEWYVLSGDAGCHFHCRSNFLTNCHHQLQNLCHFQNEPSMASSPHASSSIYSKTEIWS